MEKCDYITKGYNNSDDFEELITVNFLAKNRAAISLENCINQYYKINDIAQKIIVIEATDDKLYNKKVRRLATMMARALDKNDVETLRNIKHKYAQIPEYNIAKSLLNEKCKKVWDVINNKNIFLKVPKEGMQVLGITNLPTLDYLLSDTLNFFEKGNTDITTKVIKSILKNKNLSYKIEDIHKYLKFKVKNSKISLNTKTYEYLIKTHNYTTAQLIELGADKSQLKKLKSLKLLMNDLKCAFAG